MRAQSAHSVCLGLLIVSWVAWLALAWPCLPAAEAQTRSLRGDLGEFTVRKATPHYSLAGTIGEERFAEYARCLEYIYAEYQKGFGDLLAGNEKQSRQTEARPDSQDRFRVVILATDAQYNEFVEAYFAGQAEHTRGLFVPAVSLLIIRDDPDSSETYEVLFHEAFHQFLHRYIPFAPVWLNEGLATYYGTARPTKSGLVFDRRELGFFKVVRDAVDAKALVPLRDLTLADRRAFYDRTEVRAIKAAKATLNYAQSYTLVSYILSDVHGREHLRKYIRLLASAKSDVDARRITKEHFSDKLLASMVAPWLESVNK